MFFDNLPKLPPDPILGMAAVFAADTSPDKVDLGIGIYKDADGAAPVLQSVKTAERALLEQQTTKAYLSPAGNPAFNQQVAGLLFGNDSAVVQGGRVRTVQTPGGTGGLRVAFDFLRHCRGNVTMWVPDPTWANHQVLCGDAALQVATYPYYDRVRGAVRFDEMLQALAQAKAGDVVLLHGCCHNPTGADLDAAQWEQVAALLDRSGALPMIDIAYQGFGDGLEEDVYGLRLLSARLPEVLVASSYSKNFALYRDRVGALSFVSAAGNDADQVRTHLLRVIRGNYSMPPDHGAAVVAHILSNAGLRSLWEGELRGMRERIQSMRTGLVQALQARGVDGYSFLAGQRGMFASLGVTPDQVRQLREQSHIHMSASGRLNIAGLSERNIAHVASALAGLERLRDVA